MPHRDPLSAAELAAIYDREPTETVRELLWEIHRLRAVVLRAQQIIDMSTSGPAGLPDTLWQAFKIAVASEPALTDERTPRQQRVLDGMRAKAQRERKG